MKLKSQKAIFSDRAWSIINILFISLLLRWTLVIRGGQYYFSDEHRYQISQEVADFILQGKLGESFSHLFIAPEHLGFKIIGIVPALLEHFVRPSLIVPALFFSLFSVLNLYLIFLLAQRMGASWSESLFALVIAASSQSLLYYSRHLMPYDTAMTFGLLSLFVALKKDATAKTSILCGVLGFLCFITYNGYWILAGFAMLCHVFAGEKRIGTFLRLGMLLAVGFAIPLVLIVFLSKLVGIDILTEYARFATTVNQGIFSEGWSLPFEYFWHTEHFFFIILGLLSLHSIFNIIKRGERNPIWWIAGIVFVYGCLTVLSVFFHSFVVLGRLVRQMMPFLILLSANGLSQISNSYPSLSRLTRLVVVLIVIQGFWNYGNSFMLSYPRDFSAEAQVKYQDFSFSPKRMTFGAPELCQNNGYVMENAKYFLTAPGPGAEIKGTVLLSEPHPINFPPYQYEGYTPEQRREFRERNLRMSFYRVDRELLSENDSILKDMKNCFIKE